MLYSLHHRINNRNQAIQINILNLLLNATISVESIYHKQVSSLIIDHLNLTLMQIAIHGKPQPVRQGVSIVKAPTENHNRLRAQDAEYVFCHFHI